MEEASATFAAARRDLAVSGHLRIVVCGAGPAPDVGTLIQAAHRQSWTVEVLATGSARALLDIPAVEGLAGAPVRSSYEDMQDGARKVKRVDALVIAPATYNTVNKVALGIADTYVLTSIAEMIGRGVPTVVVPFVNAALALRAPFGLAVASLRAEGVRVLLGPADDWHPHPPGAGAEQRAAFPWERAFRLAAETAEHRIEPTQADRPAPDERSMQP